MEHEEESDILNGTINDYIIEIVRKLFDLDPVE